MGFADANLVWQIFSFETEPVCQPSCDDKHNAKKNTKCHRSDSLGFLLRSDSQGQQKKRTNLGCCSSLSSIDLENLCKRLTCLLSEVVERDNAFEDTCCSPSSAAQERPLSIFGLMNRLMSDSQD